MAVVSDALWGYAALRWRGARTARRGALVGALPDLFFNSRVNSLVRTEVWAHGTLAPGPSHSRRGRRDTLIWIVLDRVASPCDHYLSTNGLSACHSCVLKDRSRK
jgi:hypothetical protein